jgi:uncharacterized SAM-binding protein YcdF (DUF218 family)
MPTAVLGLLYAFGIPILIASFVVGCFLYAWPRTHHKSTLLAAVAGVAGAVLSITNSLRAERDLPPDFGLGVAFAVSALCAVACAEKLGRMVGSAWQRRIAT